MNDIYLRSIKVEGTVVRYKFTSTGWMSQLLTTDTMYIDYGREIEGVPQSVLAIPFVSSLIALCWLTDATMWVKELDRTFYDAVKELKRAYQELYPYCPLKGKLVSAYVCSNELKPAGTSQALLLFSGGLDAHVSYIRHRELEPVLCNIQGWLPAPDDTSQAQLADFKDTREFARDRGLDALAVKSNFALLVDVGGFRKTLQRKLRDSWWHGFSHSMSFIGIAIPQAYRLGIQKIIIASSFYLGNDGKCASYPTTDNEFKFCSQGNTLHDGFELNRQEKVRELVLYQKRFNKSYPIRVCSFNDINCRVCPKCFRTVLEIIAEGGDPSMFGFELPPDKVKFYTDYIKEHHIEFGINREASLHWPDIKARMRENIDNIPDKRFVDWFMSTDFVGKRRRAVLRYRIKNFIPLVIRRLRGR